MICCAPRLAEALYRRMRSGKGRHFGLYDGMIGNLGGRPVRIAIAEPTEESVYVAVRQMVPLSGAELVLYLGEGVAVAETLRAGDVALVGEAVRCFCPIVVTENMFPSQAGGDPGPADEFAFPDDETRHHILNAEPLAPDHELLSRALSVLNRNLPPASLQSQVTAVRAGGGVVRPGVWRAGEYLRTRFGIEVTDPGVYGAMLGAADCGIRALALELVSAGNGEDVAWEYRHRRKRFRDCAAAMMEALIGAIFSGNGHG